MSRIKSIIIAAALCCMSACAEKPWPEDQEKKLADTIRGRYDIVSMTWLGDPVDLDADGKAATDVLSELKSLSSYHVSMSEVTVSYRWYDGGGGLVAQNISLTLPIQGLERYGGQYTRDALKGGITYLTSMYNMEQGICFFNQLFASWNHAGYSMYDAKKIADSPAEWAVTGYGQLELKVTYLFYDHLTEEEVEGQVVIGLSRVEYL